MKEEDILRSHLLIVDDTSSNRLLLERTLRTEGYHNITSMDNGCDVCRFCSENKVDLILLDLMMPRMDGFQVMTALNQEIGEWMPLILVLTAIQDRAMCIKALESGARDLLIKPVNLFEVKARVRNLLEIHFFREKLRVQNEFLEEKVAERTHQLYDTRLEVISRLGRAAEYRDNETGLHTTRMSHYSRIIAQSIGFTKADADLLLQTAPMHDIGKIGIPDNILLKPGKLDPHEWDIMKTHPVVGATILSGSATKLMQWAETIALTHHEKWDGTGYPGIIKKTKNGYSFGRGKKGEDIPIYARIVALADVYDALFSKRSYKDSWEEEKVLKYIESEKEKQFDPEVVNAFFSIYNVIKAIREKYT